MIDSELISSLEALRDTYTKQQKTASGLLATLKNTQSMLNKTDKALADYASAQVGEMLQMVQQTMGGYHFKENVVDPLRPELQRQVKQLTALSAALKDALNAVQGDSIDVIRLGKAYTTLQSSKVQDESLSALLPPLNGALTDAQNELGATFGAALRDAFATQGIEVGGRPPLFEVGRFEIKAEFLARSASISYGKEVVSGRVPLSVEAVTGAFTRASKAITGRAENGQDWMRQLHDAWEIVRVRRGGGDKRANIIECYFEMVLFRQRKNFRSAPSKSGFADYSRAQFAYDFNQFGNRQRIAYKGLRPAAHVAVKSNTDDLARTLWIVEGSGPHDGRYIGDIVFEDGS